MKKIEMTGLFKLTNILAIIGLNLLLVLLFLQMSLSGAYGWDDIEHWAGSWFIFNGFVPYRDFFQHHHPLLWYLEAPIFAIVDSPWEVFQIGRVIATIFLLWGCLFMGRIIQALGGGAVSFLYALLVYFSYPVTVGSYIQNRPDTYMIFALLGGLYFWIRFYQAKKEKDLVICYFFFFLAFAFLQKAVWPLFPFGIYQIYLLIKKEIKWSSFFRAILLPFLIMMGYGLYLYQTDSLARYWELNWILNLHYFRDYQSYSYNVLDWAYGILCICFALWGVIKGEGIIRQLAFVFLAFGLIFYFMPKVYGFYWLIWTPFAAIVVGLGLSSLTKSVIFLKRFFALMVLIFICFLSYVYIFIDGQIVIDVPFEELNNNLEKHRKSGDDLVDYGDFRGVFFRNYPEHYYWYSLMRGALWDAYLFHRHELPDWDKYIYENKPKHIIYHKIYDQMKTDDDTRDKQIMGVKEDWLIQNYRYLDDCDAYERVSTK